MNTLANNLLSFITQIQALGFHPYPAKVFTWITRGKQHGETIVVELEGSGVNVHNYGGNEQHSAMFPLNWEVADVIKHIKERLIITKLGSVAVFITENVDMLSGTVSRLKYEPIKGISQNDRERAHKIYYESDFQTDGNLG